MIQGIGLSKCLHFIWVCMAFATAQVPPDFSSALADSSKTNPKSNSQQSSQAAPPSSGKPSVPPAAARIPGSVVAPAQTRKDSSLVGKLKADSLSMAQHSDSTLLSDSINLEAAKPVGRRLKFEFFEIEDAELLADLWRLTGKDSIPEEGHYQVLKVRDDTVSQAYLLREGTQVGRLPDSVVSGLRRVIRTRSGMQEGRLSQSLLGNFWNPNHPLAPFQWPTGLMLHIRHTGTVLRNSSPELEQTYGGSFGVRPFPWAHLEVGGNRSRYTGGISRNLYNPSDLTDKTFFSLWHYSGYAAIGVPGLKYELALDNRTIPEYYWLDPKGGSGAYVIGREAQGQPLGITEDYEDATVIRGWRRGGRTQPSTPNYSQTLRVKIGQIRYAAVFDPDVYNSVIHDLMFDELPAPFGQWGLGFVLAEGAAHSHIRFDLFPVTLGIPVPRNSSFQFFFLRVDIAVRDAQTFHIGLATAMRLDSPILRPGGNP